MKKKNIRNNLKGVAESELRKKLLLLQEEARIIRFKAEGARSKNVKEMSTLKKQVARILTEINK